MNPLLLDAALLFFIEIVEANLQKGRSFNDLVNYLYILKKSRPLYFFALHTSLFYVVGYTLYANHFSGWFFAIIGIKTADMMMKLRLFSKMEARGEAFSAERFFNAPDMPLSPALRYAGAFFYTALFMGGLF